jgi:glycosyltransferase involved in cell wall biosynthesis
MRVVVITHPPFVDSTSMPLFAEFIMHGLRACGTDVESLTARPFFHRFPCPRKLKKWLGYLDQFLVFPFVLRRYAAKCGPNTLFVFADQALGPWVGAVSSRPHVVHCHDLLALRSSLGEFAENPVSWSGRVYQAAIRNGFSRARNFICVSHKSSADLQRFYSGRAAPRINVVHNGLNRPFQRMPSARAAELLAAVGCRYGEGEFLLHVGGNQWYKNREGVVRIYGRYVEKVDKPLPLVMIGAAPGASLLAAVEGLPSAAEVKFVVRPPSEVVEAAYSQAAALIFPSIAEGFGWPVIEALACECRVLTTDAAPMTEAGGEVAWYLPPAGKSSLNIWADACASIVIDALNEEPHRAVERRAASLRHVASFSGDNVIRRYVSIYRAALLEG